MEPLIIVGTGLAGYTLAREVRKRDPELPMQLITQDDGCFYSKPMLSNALAKQKTAEDLATASAEKMAQDLNATLTNHTQVTAINLDTQTISTTQGEVPYAKLVLAMGADPIDLQIDAQQPILSVNDRQDYARFREALEGKHRIAIMGAGLIGCEFANDLCSAGYQVHVLDLAERPLNRLLPTQAAQALQEKFTDMGVQWHFNVAAKAFHRLADHSMRLQLNDGSDIPCDLVLSAVGLRPRTALANAAGLEVARGIVVDATLQTRAANVYALGDCAEVNGLVLPFVMPIMHAARALAATLTGDTTPARYPAMPVVVKTPAYPVVVCPPLPHHKGQWQEHPIEDGVRALFLDAQEKPLGFALTGRAVREKNDWMKQLPSWLD